MKQLFLMFWALGFMGASCQVWIDTPEVKEPKRIGCCILGGVCWPILAAAFTMERADKDPNAPNKP